jgi:signal transduction histidine kinase
VGSCGNTAFTEQPTIVEDIATHRFWRDYRELARLNEGKIGLHKEPIGVAELLKLAVKQTASLGKSRGHRLHLDAAPEPLVLDADPVRIVQVIANLLGNAAKYTPAHGERWVSAAARDGGVELVVRDSGIGIAPQVLERIFDLYAQLDLPPVGMHGGLGIGLSLVKSLAEMHDGRVTAESEGPGHGGRFRVWLPAFTERLPDEQTTTAA